MISIYMIWYILTRVWILLLIKYDSQDPINNIELDDYACAYMFVLSPVLGDGIIISSTIHYCFRKLHYLLKEYFSPDDL